MTAPRDAFADRLLDLVYAELDPGAAREVEAHAASCEACREELARLRGTRRLMARLPDEPAPAGGERVLLDAARGAIPLPGGRARGAAEAPGQPRAGRRRAPRWVWGAAALAASLAVVTGVSLRVMSLRAPTRPDDTALLGESRYAASDRATGASSPRPSPPEGERGRGRGEPPTAAERKRSEATREERPALTFAKPPPAESTTPRPRREPGERGRGEGEPDAESSTRGRGEEAPPAAPEVVASAPAAAPPPEPRRQDVEREALGVRRSAPAAKAAPSAAASRADGAAPGPRREELRRFERCEGEAVRRVETAGDGRVVRYVREGTFDGRRLRLIQTFRPDGTPAGATAQDLDTGAAVDPHALGVALVAHARDAAIDAPPRCGR